jgi:hypothetical protein
MIAADLLLPYVSWSTMHAPEVDPLVDGDALLEAQILDVRIDASTGVAGILLDLRVAIQLREANTGVLGATGVTGLRWSAVERHTRRTAWNVVGSTVQRNPNGLSLDIGCYPDATLHLQAVSLAFFSCEVPGIGDTPPDYGGDEQTVLASVATWQSEVAVLGGVERRLA